MHAVFDGLYSKVTLVVVCLNVVFPPPRSLRLLYLTVGWSEVLLEENRVGWTSSCWIDIRGSRQVFLNTGSRGISTGVLQLQCITPH
jgi:hypothetical protein